MHIFLVQHGEAKPEGEDPERPLTDTGRADIERVAALLGRLGLKPARIYHSGKRRAEESAAIFREQLQVEAVEVMPELVPMADPVPLCAKAQGWDADTMLVGHLPHLPGFVGEILKGEPYLTLVEMRPGTLIILEKVESYFRITGMFRPEALRP